MPIKLPTALKNYLMICSFFLIATTGALAQNPLGIGASEQAISPNGFFAGTLFGDMLTWIQFHQKEFYKSLTNALIELRENDSGIYYLTALSFAYGIFHAAGPGHGKAIISSYMLASEVQLRRGIYMSFAAAFVQGVTAVCLIAALLFFLRGFGFRSANIVGFLETSSYLGVTLLGCWLIWRKMKTLIKSRRLKPNSTHHEHGDHIHGADCGCGHQHMPEPEALDKSSPKQDLMTILMIGIRPCTGAIVVLTFSFLNGLYLAGVLSVFAMAVGTGITVSLLATLAVITKDFAVRFSKTQQRTATLHHIIEIFGAFLVFSLGLILLLASIN